MKERALVTGAGGFIGGHLVKDLLAKNMHVTAVDLKSKEDWYQVHDGADNWPLCDLAYLGLTRWAVRDATKIYNLAADMGGMGYIETHKAACMLSVLINTHLLSATHDEPQVERYFYASSACVYNADKQNDPDVTALKESDAYPAEAEDGYGWEKLFSERMCRHFREDYGLPTRIARFHNVYGPCFRKGTEVLTDKGWKFFEDLDRTEKIASLDSETGVVEYLLPVAYQAHEYVGDMYRVACSSVEQSVTPDHNLYVKDRTSGWGLIKADKIKWDVSRLSFTSRGTWLGDPIGCIVLPETHMTDGRRLHDERSLDPKLWFEFSGWYLSEGSSWTTSRNYTVNISQNPGPKHDRIREVIAELGFTSHSNDKNIIVSNKQLYEAVQQFGQKARGKRIPRTMMNAERPLLDRLFKALMDGDGNENGRRYSSASRQLADDVQEIALKLGYRSWVSTEETIFRVNLCYRAYTVTKREHRSLEHYEGTVYDVTLPRNHILMVRFNGKPSWSGNCGTYKGGREKAPAAICRKIIEAKLSGDHKIEIWGDGEQTRSFMWIDDCIQGIHLITDGSYVDPLNLGSNELVTINKLVDIVEEIAQIRLERTYDLTAPQGVRGRNSDNTLIKDIYDWEPSTALAVGMEATYADIYGKMKS